MLPAGRRSAWMLLNESRRSIDDCIGGMRFTVLVHETVHGFSIYPAQRIEA
jgi:hypothetical protein